MTGTGVAAAPELTAAQSADARVWIQAARATAIERFPYLDVALSAMLPIPVPGLGTVATDARWRFYYDPQRVLAMEPDCRLDQLVSDWIHEIGHQWRDHPQRWKELGQPPNLHPVFNIAGDALINHDVEAMGLPVLSTDVTFDGLPPEAGATPQMTTEEIYRRLLQTRTPDADTAGSTDPPGPQSGPVGPDCGSGAGGGRRPWEHPIDGSDDQPRDGSVGPDRADLIRHETADKVRSHVRAHGTDSVPGHLRAWSDQILDPIVDWRRELRSAVSRALSQQSGRSDYSWSRPPRRRVPGYRTPGMAAPAPPSVAVVVDTSGSMSPDDLAQCIADIASLSRSVAGSAGGTPVRVLPCDMHAGPVSLVRTKADIPTLELTGGGGTDMRIGMEVVAALRPTPDVVVVLTDGYTPWPDQPPGAAPRARYIAVIVEPDGDDALNAARNHVPPWMTLIPDTRRPDSHDPDSRTRQ